MRGRPDCKISVFLLTTSLNNDSKNINKAVTKKDQFRKLLGPKYTGRQWSDRMGLANSGWQRKLCANFSHWNIAHEDVDLKRDCKWSHSSLLNEHIVFIDTIFFSSLTMHCNASSSSFLHILVLSKSFALSWLQSLLTLLVFLLFSQILFSFLFAGFPQASICPLWIRFAIRLKIFATWESDRFLCNWCWLLISIWKVPNVFFYHHHEDHYIYIFIYRIYHNSLVTLTNDYGYLV